MKQTKLIMGMPITVEVLDASNEKILDAVFEYFGEVDGRFSTYKEASEISRINRGELRASKASAEMKEVLRLAELTKQETNGFFDIKTNEGKLDPSGLVKGWAIYKASEILKKAGIFQFYIEAGGDIQVSGKTWTVGIRNPFKNQEIVKVVNLHSEGIATSGTYMRGMHIYNPHQRDQNIDEIVSLSVIGVNVYEADRFATSAFAMGRRGIEFLENLQGLEAYMIDKDGIATQTSGFEKYINA